MENREMKKKIREIYKNIPYGFKHFSELNIFQKDYILTNLRSMAKIKELKNGFFEPDRNGHIGFQVYLPKK